MAATKTAPTKYLDAATLLAIETAVNRYPLCGIEMGSTLNDLLLIDFRTKASGWTYRDQARSVGGFIYRNAKHALIEGFADRVSANKTVFPQEEACFHKKILCTSLVKNQRCTRLIAPVVDALGPDYSAVLVSFGHQMKAFPENTAFININDWSAVPAQRWNRWQRSYWQLIPRWIAALSRTSIAHSLPLPMVGRLLELLSIQSRRTFAAIGLLQRIQPAAIVCEYDRNASTAPLILAAKHLGILTFTLQHGLINIPYGYTPLIADSILVWGQQSLDALMRFGLDPSRIHIVGHPGIQIHPLPNASASSRTKAQLGLDPEKPTILLATNPASDQNRQRFVNAFCSAWQHKNTYNLVVRLHPSELLSSYQRSIDQYGNVIFIENDKISNLDALAMTDVVVCHNTGFALEALMYRKPVVIFDVTSEPLLGAKPLVDHGGCPLVSSPSSLHRTVTKLLSDENAYDEQLSQASDYIPRVYAAYHGDAAMRVATFVRSQVASNSHEKHNELS